MPTLTASAPGPDQRPGRLAGGDVAGDDLDRVGELLDPLDRGGDLAIVAVGGVDDDEVAFGVDQRLGALEALVADRRRRRDPEPAGGILGGVGIGDRLLDVLDGDEAGAAAGIVDDDQFLDPALVEEPPRLLLGHSGADRGEIVAGHQLGDRLARIFGEADVAVGEDADQPAAFLGHRDPGDPVPLHQLERVGQSLVRGHGDRVDHHPALEALHRPHRRRLLLDGEVAVEHPHPAQLRHDDRHVGLGHRVHRRGEDRDVEPDLAGDLGAGVGLARKHRRFAGLEQHVVEGEP